MEEEKEFSKRKICIFFQQGRCKNGPNCPFLHQYQQEPFNNPKRPRAEAFEISPPKKHPGKKPQSNLCFVYKNSGECPKQNCGYLHLFTNNGNIDRLNQMKVTPSNEIRGIVKIGQSNFATGTSDGRIIVWDLNGTELNTINVEGSIGSLFCEGNFLFCGHAITLGPKKIQGILSIIEISSNSCQKIDDQHTDQIYDMAIFNTYLLTCSGDSTIKMWTLDQQQNKFICESTIGSKNTSGIFTLLVYNTLLFAGYLDGKLGIWSYQMTGFKFEKQIDAHNNCIKSLLVYQDHLVSGSQDGSFKIWDIMKNMKHKLTMSDKIHEESVSQLCICKDHAQMDKLLVGYTSGKIKIYGLPTLDKNGIIFVHKGAVRKFLVYEHPVENKGDSFFAVDAKGIINVWIFQPPVETPQMNQMNMNSPNMK